MAVGSVRVVRVEDGYVGLQCAYSWDKKEGKSISALVQLESAMGSLGKRRRATVAHPPQVGVGELLYRQL